MGVYEEAVQEIEAAYDEKRDAVTEKYDGRRIGKYQRGPKKTWPKRGGAALGGIGGGAAAVKVGATALAGTIVPLFGGPMALGAGALGGAAVGYILGGKGTDKAIDGYNRAMDGAESAEKSWYNAREAASKRTAQAASWASIDGLLGDSDEE